MKMFKTVLLGTLGGILVFCAFMTIQTVRLERRVKELEANYRELGLKQIDLVMAGSSHEQVAQAKADFLRRSLTIAPSKQNVLATQNSEANSVPVKVKSQ